MSKKTGGKGKGAPESTISSEMSILLSIDPKELEAKEAANKVTDTYSDESKVNTYIQLL